MKHVFFGFCLTLPLVLVTMFVLPALGRPQFFFLGQVSPLILTSLMAYAIVRYHALDISGLARKTLVWFLTTGIILVIIYLPVQLMRPWLHEQDNLTVTLFMSLIAVGVLAFYHLGRPALDRLFQSKVLNLSRVLEHFSRELGLLKSLDDLIRGMDRALREELAVGNLSLIVRKAPEAFRLAFAWPDSAAGDLAAYWPFLAWLEKWQDIVSREQIEADPELKEVRPLAAGYFGDLGVELAIPLIFDRRLLGVVNLGPKTDQERYGPPEYQILSILRHDLAIALSNSFLFEEVKQLYQEVKDFNLTLEGRVAERTADLEAAMRQLQHLDKLKSDFISMASHELRTPMTAVKGAISLALESQQGGESGEAQLRLLTLANRNVDRMISLINDILDLSKLEAGQMTLQLESVPMREVVQSAVDSLLPLLERKKLRVVTQFPSEPLESMGDRARLIQVLVNLLGNAIKYSPAGGQVTMSVQAAVNMIECSVQDEGAGIEPTVQEKIFEKFGQAGHELTSPEEGTGLGLAIVKKIVELHHGQIWVESQPGRGSKFTFRVPAKP